MRGTCALFFFAALSASPLASQPAPAAVQNGANDRIVPAQRIGPLILGMSDDELVKLLGEGTGDTSSGRMWRYWPSDKHGPWWRHFTTYAVRDDNYRVGLIRVTGGQYATAAGISTHSSIAQIWKAYPHLQWAMECTSDDGKPLDIYDDNQTGIAFQLWRDPKGHAWQCYGILVHKPGCAVRALSPVTPAE